MISVSYASNINSLNSSLSKIDSSKNKISNNTINNYWKGNASSKQLEKIKKLMDAINTQKDQVNKLISALNLIDEIDSLKATIDSYNDYLSKYDSEPSRITIHFIKSSPCKPSTLTSIWSSIRILTNPCIIIIPIR